MLEFIEKILNAFKSCFTRQAAFRWFSVIIVGLMLGTDRLGLTSIMRSLSLNSCFYETMNHFFRATSWRLDDIRQKWMETVHNQAPLWKEDEYTILIGDGVKQAKEGKRMPGVKKQYQESENSSKPEYIFGHFFGGIGVLAGSAVKAFCIPLYINIQDGIQTILNWGKEETEATEETEAIPSHIVQMIENGYEAAKVFGKSILLLDRYFLSVTALSKLAELNNSAETLLHIITKAKRGCVAYERPPEKKTGRGRPSKKGNSIKLQQLFIDKAGEFIEDTVMMYGKLEKVRYYCINLLWGQKLYRELRFVLVEYNGIKSILACTDIRMEATTIIRLYSYRFKIECTFRELKQVLGGFCYRFWSKSMPVLKRYLKTGEKAPIEMVTDKDEQEKIILTVKATEGYVMFNCIAMGIIQMLSLFFSKEFQETPFRYLRTPSKAIVSEATVVGYLRKNIFRIMAQKPHLSITRFIQDRQEPLDISDGLRVS